MKKIVGLLIIGLITLNTVGCGSAANNNNNTTNNSNNNTTNNNNNNNNTTNDNETTQEDINKDVVGEMIPTGDIYI